ncbi:hypothetical protein V8B97DRAFT_2001740 [Scleroderma yunnanense]
MDPQRGPHPDRPDYSLPQFEGLVNLVIGNTQMTRDEAIAVLNEQWELQHPNNEQPPQPPPAEPRRCRRQSSKTTPTKYGSQCRCADHLTTHSDAWKHSNEKTEPLTIAQEDEGSITLKPAHAVGPSKNARLNALLPFTDFLFAKNIFLCCIEEVKWGNVVVDSFNWFFHRLKVHDLQQEGECGKRALVHYAAHVHQDWHDKMTQKCGYNIVNINENLLNKIAWQLDSKDVQTGLSKVLTGSPPHLSLHSPVMCSPTKTLMLWLLNPLWLWLCHWLWLWLWLGHLFYLFFWPHFALIPCPPAFPPQLPPLSPAQAQRP